MQPGQPLWLEHDSQAVLEYLREKALTCPGCGQPRDESMDPDAEDHYRTRAIRCHACAARDRAQKQFRPEESGGLYISAERMH